MASTIDANTTTQSQVAAGIDSEAGALSISDSTISDNTATNSKSTGGLGIYGDEGVDGRIDGGDAFQGEGHELPGRELGRSHLCRQPGQRLSPKVHDRAYDAP